jgi:galactokinase
VDFEIGSIEPTRRGDWSDYVRGVAWVLESAGLALQGADLSIRSNVPAGAGLSSSAALEVAVALALVTRSGIEIQRRELALLCQRAENEFVGVRCGIMDQLTACMGRRDHALLLDCRSLNIDYLRIPAHLRLAVCNSMIKHDLASSEYNRRREECENAVAILSRFLPNVRQLRDLSLLELERVKSDLEPTAFRRCRHVVSENQRTVAAAAALRSNDLATLGALMNESHNSLRDDYEVSCSELDILVELARAQNGVYGSRMTGGGFGGCTISLLEENSVNSFAREVSKGYPLRTGKQCEIYICEAAAGAREEVRIQ